MPMFVLIMNDMRASKVEIGETVFRAETKEALEAFLAKEKVPNYTDTVDGYNWGKTYRKGGPLEWYNECVPDNPWGHGIQPIPTEEEYLKSYRERYQAAINSVPLVPPS